MSLYAKIIKILFDGTPEFAGAYAPPQFRYGTPSRRIRKKGKPGRPGSKLAKKARARELGMRHPGGAVSSLFQESVRERNKARLTQVTRDSG